MTSSRSRADWLAEAAEMLRPVLNAAGVDFGEVRIVAVTPPPVDPATAHATVGMCALGSDSPRIFISPRIDDGLRVLDVLAHELIHASLEAGVRHGPEFRRAARAIGLTGRPRATVAGPEFTRTAQAIADRLGAYPPPSPDHWQLAHSK